MVVFHEDRRKICHYLVNSGYYILSQHFCILQFDNILFKYDVLDIKFNFYFRFNEHKQKNLFINNNILGLTIKILYYK